MAKWLLAACVLGAGWLYHTWVHDLEAFYRQQIPFEVEVADLAYWDSGIRGSCGAAIFDQAGLLRQEAGPCAQRPPRASFQPAYTSPVM